MNRARWSFHVCVDRSCVLLSSSGRDSPAQTTTETEMTTGLAHSLSSSADDSFDLCMAPPFLSPRELGQMMESRPSSVQLVDCRSFLNYNADRITGSVNIFCPPLVKKRFSSSVLPLSTMLSAETRATLCRSVVDAVVMYDDDTDEESWQSRRCDLQLVMDSLMLFLQPGRITFYVLAGKAKNHEA